MRRKKLKDPWKSLSSAIFLIGLAILAWQGWWWPGILVLIAVSLIVEAAIQMAVPEAVADEAAESLAAPKERGAMPGKCPQCGAPLSSDKVEWTSPASAKCSFCGAEVQTSRS